MDTFKPNVKIYMCLWCAARLKFGSLLPHRGLRSVRLVSTKKVSRDFVYACVQCLRASKVDIDSFEHQTNFGAFENVE